MKTIKSIHRHSLIACALGLSCGLLTLTSGVASAQIVEYQFNEVSPSGTTPTGTLYDNTSETSPGVLGWIGQVASGTPSTFTTDVAGYGSETFTLDVNAIIQGTPQLYSGGPIVDEAVVINPVLAGGVETYLTLGATGDAANEVQFWSLDVAAKGGIGFDLIADGLGYWSEVQQGTGPTGGTGPNGGNGVPDGGSTLALSLFSLMALGVAARRFKTASV
jgi:hypothetical protein